MQPVLTIFCVTLAVAVLAVLARRVGTASSILLLVAGVALSFVPGVPAVRIEPEVVLLLLLPPLLYSSGVAMSWRDFRADLRPILLLAVGCVLFTALGVAAIAHWVLGLSWPVGFVLGAVVSPPDAVAPMAILHRLGLPRRILTILNGESLVNDATALVLLSFALTAVVTGGVSPLAALGRFGAIVGGEIGWGLLVGWAMLRARHLAHDPRAEVVLALATPFIAFWPPHEAGGSGVIACVMSGLWVSWNGRRLIRPATRLQGFFIWGLVTWLVEGALFLLTGLQARAVMAGVALQGWSAALVAAAIVCAAVIVLRFVWVFPATYLPRLVPAVRARDPQPDWRLPFLVGFTGLRGVVSLAAALSIPLQIGTEPFRGAAASSVPHVLRHRLHPDRPGFRPAVGGAAARPRQRRARGAAARQARRAAGADRGDRRGARGDRAGGIGGCREGIGRRPPSRAERSPRPPRPHGRRGDRRRSGRGRHGPADPRAGGGAGEREPRL